MHRLEHRRMLAQWIQIGRWRYGNRSGAGRTKVGQDIAEQIAANHNVESVRHADEVRRQNIDVILVDINIRIALGHFCNARVPVRHRMDDAIRFGGGGQVFCLAALCQLEGVFQYSICTATCEHTLLYNYFVVGAFVVDAANL